MTRINRPDTLLTELRDINRRLRLLEAGRMRPPASQSAGASAPSPLASPAASLAPSTPESSSVPPVPLMPARAVDWPGTGSLEWERLAVTWTVLDGQRLRVALHVAAEAGTTGVARVVVDGNQVGEVLTVTQTPSRQTVDIPAEAASGSGAESEIGVEARRVSGAGLIRVAALLLAAQA